MMTKQGERALKPLRKESKRISRSNNYTNWVSKLDNVKVCLIHVVQICLALHPALVQLQETFVQH